MTTVSLAVTPAPAVGCAVPSTTSGGHVLVQPPLQRMWLVVSGARWYSVRPLASTRTVPSLVDAVFTVEPPPEAAADVDEDATVEGVPDDVVLVFELAP